MSWVLALEACVLAPGILRMFFALALMPLVVESVVAYVRLTWTNYTFWSLGTGMLWMFSAFALMPLAYILGDVYVSSTPI